jgi:hypothetical protein
MVLFLLVGVLAPTGCAPILNLKAQPISATCRNAASTANPIAAENTCPGTSAWHSDLPVGPAGALDGFTAPTSVVAGNVAQLYVTTTASWYTYAIYRMGYYRGLGGRLIYQSPPISGFQQPACTVDPVTHMVECSWYDPVAIQTRSSWVSGMYLIQLISADGYERYDFFVVRDASPRAPILYSLPFTTYQAYNLWGGYSLYFHRHPDGPLTKDRAEVVSFDRPFNLGNTLGQFGLYDLPLLSWMESQSYNMTYIADFDLDALTIPLNRFKLIVSSGHAEYWSAGMRANVTKARDAGVSLVFFGGNQVYWQVRFQPSPLGVDRHVTCYRFTNLDPLAATNPQEATVRWRDPPLNQPEASLLGQQYAGILAHPAALQLAPGSAPFLAGTFLTPGSSFPNLVAGEYDRIVPGMEPVNLQIIASSPVVRSEPGGANGTPDISNTTIYTAASGAKVFDAGTFGWAWGLSDIVIAGTGYPDASFQQLTANILTYLLRDSPAPQGGGALRSRIGL